MHKGVVLVLLAVTLAGCTGSDPTTISDKEGTDSTADDKTPGGGDKGNTSTADPTLKDMTLLLQGVKNVTEGKTLEFSLQATVDDPSVASWTVTVSAITIMPDGNESLEEIDAISGEGLPAELNRTDVGGLYLIEALVDAPGYNQGMTSARYSVIVSTEPEAEPDPCEGIDFVQETITLTGTTSGALGAPGSNTHKFELQPCQALVRAHIENLPNAFDIDWSMRAASGRQVASQASFELGMGENDLVTDKAADLAEFGEWSIIVVPYAAAAADYEITVTFA